MSESYYLDAEDLAKLRLLSSELQGGNDRERDYGHRLWLIVNRVEETPVLAPEAASKPSSSPTAPVVSPEVNERMKTLWKELRHEAMFDRKSERAWLWRKEAKYIDGSVIFGNEKLLFEVLKKWLITTAWELNPKFKWLPETTQQLIDLEKKKAETLQELVFTIALKAHSEHDLKQKKETLA